MSDNIKHPSHYAEGRNYEPKDVIRDWGLNFNLGSAVKYVARAGRKDDIVQDLKKAQQFIQFEIDAIEAERSEAPAPIEDTSSDNVISLQALLNLNEKDLWRMIDEEFPQYIAVDGKEFVVKVVKTIIRYPATIFLCNYDGIDLEIKVVK